MFLWDASLSGSAVISIAVVYNNFFDSHFNYIAFGMCHSKGWSGGDQRKQQSLQCDTKGARFIFSDTFGGWFGLDIVAAAQSPWTRDAAATSTTGWCYQTAKPLSDDQRAKAYHMVPAHECSKFGDVARRQGSHTEVPGTQGYWLATGTPRR